MEGHEAGRSWKTRFPALPEHFIQRSRIYRILDEHTGVIFLNGKRGSGKTSAVSGYCKEQTSVFRYSFEKEDNNEVYFRRHFFTAVTNVKPDASLLECMENIIKSSFSTLVFDNVQLLSNRNILQAILFLLETNCTKKIILIMSETPSPGFSRYLAAGNYKCITEQELYFSAAELKQLIAQYFHDDTYDEAYALKMQELTEGWPVASACILRYYARSGEPFSNIKNILPAGIFKDTMFYDYIDYEIYAPFSVRERQFLAWTAVFHKLDAALCRYCTGEEYAADMLRKFRRKYLINKENYSPLIRYFLLEQTTGRQKQKLMEKAGNFYTLKEDFKEAFFYKKENVTQVHVLLQQHGKEMLQQNLLDLIEECFSVLTTTPEEWHISELEIAAEYYYRRGNRERMEYCLNTADSRFGRENKYAVYRSLYRGLFHYEENPEKYEKQINNALFFLKENRIPLPYFMENEQKMLDKIRQEKETELKEVSSKKIKVSAFGTFRAVFIEDGKELSWRTKKGCELFAYLVYLKGGAVERKTLLTELWHEEIPNNAVAMLHNMFYNIRKELSYYNLESMIEYKNKKYVMDVSVIESDVDDIQKAAEYVEKKKTGQLFKKRHLFDTYWGRYLEDMDSEWVRDRQEYYEKIYEKGCRMIADAFMEQAKYEEAVLYLKNALSVNNYSETIMELLLKCYSNIGDFNSIRKQYGEFCLLLKKELGITPGEELQNSYRRCISR